MNLNRNIQGVMKRLIFSFLFIIFSTTTLISQLQASSLRIATYNLWNPIFEEKYSGKNTWGKRLPFIVDNIISSESDVICLEEVGKEQYNDLIQNSDVSSRYNTFYFSHVPSKPGQKEGRDGLAFLYKPEKITLMNVVQSADGSRPTHRRDFYVDLKLSEQRDTPVQFRVACTHLDADKDITLGNTQLAALVEDVLMIDAQGGIDFVIVCGDFNEGEDDLSRPRYEIMRNAGFFTDGSIEATRPEALEVRHKGHIDWIYFKQLSALNFDLLPLTPIGDEKASDHKLTMTDVEID